MKSFLTGILQLIGQFFSQLVKTFINQGIIGKVILGVFFLNILCCWCIVPISILNPKTTPLPDLKESSHASAIILDTLQPTQYLTEAPTQLPTSPPTTEPLPTQTVFMIPTVSFLNTVTPTPISTQIYENIQVSFIDVGQGDSILIRSPEGLYGLIDGGDANSGIVQYLQSQNVKTLDLMVASHPNADHIGGLVEVLQTIPTARVVTNGDTSTTMTYENFLDAIASSKAEYIEVKRGDTLNLGSMKFDVLNPGEINYDNKNTHSIVLRMQYDSTVFLFMGDADSGSEAEMMAAGILLTADIVKIGHHGSGDATSKGFLAEVKPKVAIYTAGKGNDYGLPNSDTIGRVINSGANVLGTDINGTIIFTVDETGYSFKPEKEGVIAEKSFTIQPTSIQLTATETITSAPVELSITVVSLTSPINAGSNAKLTIKTAPGAKCSITVIYKSGPSQAAGLGEQVTDDSGQVTWKWKVGSRTTPGTWAIIVTAEYGGKTESITIPFEVQ